MYLNYLILAHKNLAQVDRLIDNLMGESTYVYIHIDKRVPAIEIKKYRFASSDRVKVIRNRIAIYWGGFSMVRATLNLMKAASSKEREGYYILLSGQDFPLRSNENIYSFFQENQGSEFMNFWKMPYKGWVNGGLDRIKYYWFVDKIGMYNSNLFCRFQQENNMERAYFKDYPPYGGSQWWCLTLHCIRYMLDFIERHPVVCDFFETTLIPDESFFSTILLNSPFSGNVVNDNLRYIVFEGGKPHPNLLGITDFSRIIDSEKLWARKFDINHDQSVLTQIEEHISKFKEPYVDTPSTGSICSNQEEPAQVRLQM
ncbi:beta-1,6-N-acetylglucosaminyltransferase [Dyadobacter sediminis]|uniref:Peptide O-xylosyltransferase n=1 Tax=Dyadobacter sediminis TaxID=1493691 RepID=A0A5R9K6M2_9BACT|nr:beta-1,6-N-acetylglucosaminyltransferase [Dyadobacter sediminis]TLU89423.1 hypothetical protein FEM55_22035 [Dyadobacter sediminis]GGC05566.1 glycosyl transferase [Dyadobacter sediminis]